VWSAVAPCTSTSGLPSPLLQTAINVPSFEATSSGSWFVEAGTVAESNRSIVCA
jgi:hypothetical protein